MKKALAIVACAAVMGITTAAVPTASDSASAFDLVDTGLHLALKESAPKKDEVLTVSPSKVTLWFTQAPQMSGTSIRLLPKGGEPLDVGSASVTEDDDAVVVLPIPQPLGGGEYQAMWRAMAGDGHTIRGEFGFTVQAQR